MRQFKHKNPRKLENDWKLQISEQQLLILLMGNGTRSVITVLYLEILPVRSCQGFEKIIQHSRQPLRHGWVCDYRLYSSCHQLKHLDRLIPHQVMVPEQQNFLLSRNNDIYFSTQQRSKRPNQSGSFKNITFFFICQQILKNPASSDFCC